MKNTGKKFEFSQRLLDEILNMHLPVFDLWQIRPFDHNGKVILTGTSNDWELLADFMTKHGETRWTFPIVLVLGVSESVNTEIMLRHNRSYINISFDRYKELNHENIEMNKKTRVDQIIDEIYKMEEESMEYFRMRFRSVEMKRLQIV